MAVLWPCYLVFGCVLLALMLAALSTGLAAAAAALAAGAVGGIPFIIVAELCGKHDLWADRDSFLEVVVLFGWLVTLPLGLAVLGTGLAAAAIGVAAVCAAPFAAIVGGIPFIIVAELCGKHDLWANEGNLLKVAVLFGWPVTLPLGLAAAVILCPGGCLFFSFIAVFEGDDGFGD